MKDEYIKQTFKTLSNLAVDMIRTHGFDKVKSDVCKLNEVCEQISEYYNLDDSLHGKFAMSILNRLIFEEKFIIMWDCAENK